MRLNEKFARLAGAATGVVTGLVLPHVFCLGPILIGVVGAGASGAQSQNLAYMAGGVAVLAALLVGTYGAQPCNMPACRAFGETPAVRLRKAALMVVPGLAVAAVANTYFGRGLSDPALTAGAIQMAMYEGRSVWDIIASVCTTGNVPGFSPS